MPHWDSSRPATSTQLMLQLATGEYGLSLATCLSGSGISPEQIADPTCELRGLSELEVFRNVLRALGPDVPFPLMAGLRYHPTSHGMWGFAVLSSACFRDAIEVGLRYWDLSYSFNHVRFEIDGPQARFVYDSSANPDDLQAALVERDLAALVTFERDIHGRMLPPISMELRGARPTYAAEFAPLFGVEPRFGCASNRFTFDAALLETRQSMADTFGRCVSEEQCRLLIERRGARSGVAGQVRAQILHKPGEFPDMQQVAARLGTSTRTLRNQLARERTSYRELIEEIRETLAEELLSSSRLTVDEIAARLGYADTSSFVAAFKRWKGRPPGEYKRVLHAPDRG
jgi:AraC-like DNA-binding protein